MSEVSAAALPRVLIVDDSRMVRASIVKRIKDAFDIREEGDGEAAWQTLLVDQDIQVVISDLSMPRLDGYGLLERIRSSKIVRVREMPVIMISGDEDDNARQRAKACGATDFITKGTGTVELLARLEALIKLGRTRQQLEQTKETAAQTAAIDPASGLFTRTYIEKQSEQALSHGKRHQSEITALAIGLDCFDALIGEHGEALGEKLAAQFAKMLQGSVRKEDSVARIAPCDFMIVSPSTSQAASVSFAERLRGSIERAAISYAGQVLKLTVSVGIAHSLAEQLETASELLDQAEARMAAGREAGGNRVVASPAPERREVQPPTLDRALALLQTNQEALLKPHLTAITASLLPLLKLIEHEYRLGLPLSELDARFGTR